VGQFGDKFKNAREKRNLSLDDVSNVTKIGSRMLQAIEEEHFDQLPGGVFNKGFIRAYAKHLGLNDEEAVTEYLACLRQAQIDAQASWNPQARPPAPEKRPLVSPSTAKSTKEQPPPPREELPELQLPKAEHVRPPRRLYGERRGNAIPWRLVVVTVVVVFLAAVLWNRRSHKARAGATTASPTPALQAATQSATGAVPQSSAGNSSSQPRSSSNISNPQAPPIAQPKAPAAQPGSHPIATVKANSSSGTQDDSNNAEPDVVSRTIQNAPPVTAKTPPSANPSTSTTAASMTLVIRASENSWISVTADGQQVSQETLIAPAHTSIRANREIVVRAGNAAGVSFLWNGKEIPAQGTESEVKTLVFDAAGMRVISTVPGDQNR
jgi:cytoskeletal protein RodZ